MFTVSLGLILGAMLVLPLMVAISMILDYFKKTIPDWVMVGAFVVYYILLICGFVSLAL